MMDRPDGCSPLFDPLDLKRGMTLRNRIVMAPMTTWSANDDATISDEENLCYRRSVAGVGLVVTVFSHVTAMQSRMISDGGGTTA